MVTIAEQILQNIHTSLNLIPGYFIFRNNINMLNGESEVPALLLNLVSNSYEEQYLDSPHVHWLMTIQITSIISSRLSSESKQLELAGILHQNLMTQREILDGAPIYYQGFNSISDDDGGASNFSIYQHDFTIEYHTTALDLMT